MEDPRGVVLVEGPSDKLALEALAARRRLDLARERVVLQSMGGAHAIGRFTGRFPGARVAGLCDVGERGVFLRALPSDAIFVCVADLEDELIRAHGADGVLALLAEHGDLSPFRTFQRQPAWRGRPVDAQLRRFFTSSDGRKLRYTPILVATLPPERVPSPLVGALDYALSPGVTTPAS